MNDITYIDVLLPLPLSGTFTYSIPAGHETPLCRGMRVSVPFGKKNTYTGLIVKVHKKKPGYEVRDALELPDQKPVIMDSQLALWQWMSTYYMCSEGEIFKAALPARLNLTKKTRKKKPVAEENTFLLSVLNQPQQLALDEIKNKFSTLDVVLLHGITSSGKTEVYIHLIEEAIKNGGQVLYLLPEIALTTQIINRLSKAFGPGIAVYHSKYSDSERIKTWNRMVNEEPGSEKAVRIVLGVRSAIFLPFQKLGLIIVDEEHENTYKQFDPAPRYHARDTAIMLARQCGAKVLLGTATPSIETYHNCKTGKYGLVELNERYRNLQLPEIIVENTRTLRRRKQMQSHFSPMLLQQIQEALKNGEQVILFQNRRGFSLFLVCDQCGAVPRCKHCDVSLTYHKRNNRLYCHYCGYHTHVPAHCPECSEGNLQMKGFGTEKIEEEIGLFFPEARIERMDLDAARSRKTYETLIARFELKQSDILVGTQMISKGLNFDNVKLVGILDADTMLNFPDFRAHERSYQLMSQVSGRAGRRNNRGKVIIQTSYDQHPIVTCVVNNNYQAMYADQIDERYRFSYPPFSRLIKITLKHKDTGRVDKAAEYLANILKETISAKILGPEYPLISRIQNFYLKNLLIKIEKFGQLQHIKQQIAAILNDIKSHEDFKAVQYVVDVDPF